MDRMSLILLAAIVTLAALTSQTSAQSFAPAARMAAGPVQSASESPKSRPLALLPLPASESMSRWQISDRMHLSVEAPVSSDQNSRLTVRYDAGRDLGLTLSAYYTGSGDALGTYSWDGNIPVVLGLSYDPRPGTRISVFAGAEVDTGVSLNTGGSKNAGGAVHQVAPLAGLGLTFSF
ncbi:hypothetical protein shim_14040 [Shimia sp. SK013]|uniref:hypothetical protein n=1 Tax=Shimia sp. SK013 TaxID=1389006 RepID=UPI0006CD070D|nr:hypothetical protein [Shimia sp. SK013]KPA23110.1 hypothetical protein shim_14040 [Shimia sp. SK013]